MKVIFCIALFFIGNLSYASTVCKAERAAVDLRNATKDISRLESLKPHPVMVKRRPEMIPEWIGAQYSGTLNSLIIKTMQYNALISGCSCGSLKSKGQDFELELYQYQRKNTNDLKVYFKTLPAKINQATQGAESC